MAGALARRAIVGLLVAMSVMCASCGADDAALPAPPATDTDEALGEDVGAEQVVMVHLALAAEFGTPAEQDAVFALEPRLEEAIEVADVGLYDGNEFGGNEAVLYAYGPDADALFAAMEPVLREFGPAAGSFAVKIYNDDPADDVVIPLA